MNELKPYGDKPKFIIKDSTNKTLFFAIELAGRRSPIYCSCLEFFNIIVIDKCQQVLMHLNRKMRCAMCCVPCCLQTLEVSSPPGVLIGTVEQEWSLGRPCFRVRDENDETQFRIRGPRNPCTSCGKDVDFKIFMEKSGDQIGQISKQWSDLSGDAFTHANYFGITFLLKLDVKFKAVLLGACFLMEYMYGGEIGRPMELLHNVSLDPCPMY